MLANEKIYCNILVPCSAGKLRLPRLERFMRGAEPVMRQTDGKTMFFETLTT